jgi:signal transduction histidine kinase
MQNGSTYIDTSSHPAQNGSTCIDTSYHPTQNSSAPIGTSSHSAQNDSIYIDAFSHPAQNNLTYVNTPTMSSASNQLNDAQVFLHIHVRDNGPGIPEEYRDTLFDPFVTHKLHGTGLGLSIVKNIMVQHGGTITVSTCTAQPDTCTDFCLTLPVLQTNYSL